MSYLPTVESALKWTGEQCATGFDTSFRPPFETSGKNGYKLDEEYAKGRLHLFLVSSLHADPGIRSCFLPFGRASRHAQFLGHQRASRLRRKWLHPTRTGRDVSHTSEHSMMYRSKATHRLDYVIAAINKTRRHGIKSMLCKPECAEEFNYHTDRFVQERGVWSDKCSCKF